MSGKPNKEMFKTMVRKHGSEEAARQWFGEIGRIGGKVGRTGGFWANRELARTAGRKGGQISKRGASKITFDDIWTAVDSTELIIERKESLADRLRRFFT